MASARKRSPFLTGMMTLTRGSLIEWRRAGRARRSAHAESPDHRLVEDEAETRGAGDLHHAARDRRAMAPERLPHRVALRISEALDGGAVRDRGDQMLGELGLLVMRHLDAAGPAERGGAAPVRHPSSLRRVVVD